MEEETLDRRTLFRKLLSISESPSFTIRYPYQGRVYLDFVTSEYFYTMLGNSGYIALDSFDESLGEKLVYCFYVDSSGDFRLAYPYESGGRFLNDVSSFNYLAPLESVLQVQNFVEENGELYSSNESIVYALAMQLGYQQDAVDKTFSRVRFYLEDGNLSYALQIYDASLSTSVDVADCSATFLDVGQSVLPHAEAFLSDFGSLSEESLDPASLDNLSLGDMESVALEAEMRQAYVGGEETTVGKTTLIRREGEINVEVDDGETLKRNLYFDDDGYAAERGLNAHNEVDSERLGEYYLYEEMFPEPLEVLLPELDSFRLYQGRYRYFGFNADEINDAFTSMGVYGRVESIYLDLDENGDFAGLEVTYPEMRDEDGRAYSVLIKAKVAPNLRFVDVTPNQSLDAEEEIALERAFALFDGSIPFKIESHEERTTENELNLYYDGEALVYEEKSMRLSGGVTTNYEGYYLEDGLIQRFIKPHGEEASRNGEAVEGELGSHFGFHVSPLLFEKGEDGYYRARPHLLGKVKESLLLGRNGDEIVIMSLALRLDEEGRLVEMRYDTDDGLLSTGTDIVGFTYGEVSLPGGLEGELSSLPSWVEPTTWEEDSPDVYADFVSFYGKEAADTIPYLYHPETYRKWNSTYIFTVDVNNETTSGCDEEWYAAYKELLIASGYVLDPEPDLPGAEVYSKGIVTMRLAKILVGGIYFDILE